MIPVVGWKFGLLLLPAAIWYGYKHRVALARQAAHLIATRSFGMLWVAFVVAVPFGQLVGHGSFLQMVMGGQYTRDYKRVIEELCELMGYILLVIGSVEMFVQLRSLEQANAAAQGISSQEPLPRDPLLSELRHAAGDSAT